MNYRKAITGVALSLAAFASINFASAADLPATDVPIKAKKPVADLPFFLLTDDRVSFSWMPKGTDPGFSSIQPNGSVNGTTAKQVYSFTHFDIWSYGTNFFTISMLKSDHNDSSNPCTNTGIVQTGGFAGPTTSADCAGATEFYGLFRSTFGWNEIFDTKAFTYGPLHNISFEVGADAGTDNDYVSEAKRDVVFGLQFAFDLPYKGYIDIAPLAYKEMNYNAFQICNGTFAPGVIPGETCSLDGNMSYNWTWSIEANYYMDLGFLPENMQYFSISGRAGVHGPKGDMNGLPANSGPGVFSTASKTEINSEPIRLTFDASKAFMGPKYTHLVDLWVAYRYWQNKFGLDHNATFGICNIPGANGGYVSTNSCTEQTVYAGVTMKF